MNATHGAGPGRRHDPVDHRLLLRARRVDMRFSNRRSMVRRVIGTMPAVEAVSPNYTEARQNLKSLMDAAVDGRVTVIITRTKGEPVIMMAKSECDAMMETFHLLRSPRNAERLREGIGDIEAGRVVPAALVDGEIEQRA